MLPPFRPHAGASGWVAIVSATEKRLLSVREFCERYGIGRTRAYSLLHTGAVQAVKVGASTRIPVESAEAWAASLPAWPRPPGA